MKKYPTDYSLTTKNIYIFNVIRKMVSVIDSDIEHFEKCIEIRKIVKIDIIDEEMEIPFVVYKEIGCYYPKILNEYSLSIFNPRFISSLIYSIGKYSKNADNDMTINMGQIMGSDLSWDITQQHDAVAKSLNYAKIKGYYSLLSYDH